MTRPVFDATDSLRPIALEAVRTAEQKPTTPRPHRRASSVLWFLGAAVFSFSTMAALDRRGLSQLLMPARPPTAVTAADPPIVFSATRRTHVYEDALTSPWRHRERDESKAPRTGPSTAAATPVAATTAAAPPPPKRDATTRSSPARAAAPVATGAKPDSGSDEVAAAAAMLEKAKGERSLE